tara:strand:- start:22 stop:162 length:141 start_codon:yes stop_codon:yes gene_type:complete
MKSTKASNIGRLDVSGLFDTSVAGAESEKSPERRHVALPTSLDTSA